MMMTTAVHEEKIPDTLIEIVRERTDIVAVVSQHLALKKSGSNFVGLCPFHSEKTPSFVVNPVKQFFHCFGCSAGGDIFSFLSKIDQISFPEAVRRLAEKSGVKLPSEKSKSQEERQKEQGAEAIYKVNGAAAVLFHKNLMEQPEAATARAYLQERGISVEMINTFSIGFALPRGGVMRQLKYPDTLLEKAGLIRRGENGLYDYFRNRIMFPIKTLSGKIAGFGGRALDDTPPKYLNTSETPVFTKGKQLFGLDLARGKKSLIVVEGYFDAISLYQAGVTNVVATLGTALTIDHLHLIQRFVEKVYLIFDPDTAGVRAALRAAPLLTDSNLLVDVISLPKGCDPDLFIRQKGNLAFSEMLQRGKPLLDFVISEAARSAESIDDKAKSLQALFPLIRKKGDTVREGYYLKKMAEAFGIEEKDLRADFQKKGAAPLKGTPKGRPYEPLSHGPFPEDEKTLLALFIQDRLDPKRLCLIHPDDFVTPLLKDLMAFFWNDESRSWYRPQGLLAHLNEDQKSIFTELSVIDIPSDNQERLQEDCIGSLRTKRLRREAQKIQKELKSAEREGDHARVASLQHAFFNLKVEMSRIVSSH